MERTTSMNPVLKILYQPYKWLIVIPFVFCITMLMASICIVAGVLLHQGYTVNMIAVIWAKLCCWIAPISVSIQGKDNYNPNQSYVIVSNHQSMVDIPVLHAHLGLPIKWIMKKELKKIPIFGTACHQLGCIYVDRSNHEAAVQSIQDAKEKLTSNACVLFFVEGTRTRDGKLLPFKKGAFRFAKEMNLPILPLTIQDSIYLLPSDSLDLVPGTTHIQIHPPIDTTDTDIHNLEPLMKKAHDTIASAL